MDESRLVRLLTEFKDEIKKELEVKREIRRNNLVVHGLEEIKNDTYFELEKQILNLVKEEVKVDIKEEEIDFLKDKDVYISEDYPKEIIEKRKELKEQMLEERKKGKFAIIVYDKLIVREYSGKKKRRASSGTPQKERGGKQSAEKIKVKRVKDKEARGSKDLGFFFRDPNCFDLKDFIADVDVQTLYDDVENGIKLTINNQPETKKVKISKLSDKTKELIRRRQQMRNKKNKNKKEKIETNQLCKLTRIHIRQDIQKWNNDMVQRILESNNSIKKVNKLLYTDKKWVTGLKNKNDNTLQDRIDIINEATSFFREVYSEKEPNATSENRSFLDDDEMVVEKFLEEEIRFCIRKLKKDKTPGEDSITNEVIQLSAPILLKPLTLLFNRILETEMMPKQWDKSNIILIAKKGNTQDLNNFRPISLLSNFYKLFMMALKNRLIVLLNENQSIEQAGFRSGFSTIDHLQAINQILEKAREYRITIYMALIDFQKAFDSVRHSYIYEALYKQGVHCKYIRILRYVYSHAKIQVRMDRTGSEFEMGRGVRQGDPLSPNIFNAVLEQVFRELNWENLGIKINGRKLNNLRFADDVVLFAASAEELSNMIEDLLQQASKAGLGINAQKTKLLTNGPESAITINGEEVKWVSESIYLGQTISFQNRTTQEVNRRISISWRKFWSLKHVFKAPLTMEIKKQVFNSCITPCLLYGAQTWSLTRKNEQRLRCTQRAMERSILGVKKKDRVRATVIRKKTCLTDVVMTAKKMKWKWAGHLCRFEDERWTRTCLEWCPFDRKRRRGRQFLRWRDELKGVAGMDFSRKAKSREEWATMGEAFAQKWA
ncbi:uncharacterized protein [Rhodnius prolixus]|uniref:uncharacterized protein n=1 Tax=Rhodnius prolixus TaxID=13249 RepID=UPI003D18F1B6